MPLQETDKKPLLLGRRLLIVDDEPQVRQVLQTMLSSQGAICSTAASVREAREVLAANPAFELVVADLHMPEESGADFVRSLAVGAETVATLVISGDDDPSTAAIIVGLGAYGYITKPFSLNEIVIAVHNALRRRELELERQRARESKERALHEETVRRLAAAAELRDLDTGEHLQRMSAYAATIARGMGLPEERVELLRVASTMHDVGKIGIPDYVLLKPGKLTLEERILMQEHPEIGHSILADSEAELLRMGALLALTHHERCDGSGYPKHLFGDEIPLEGRIVAVADVFDALTSDRIYRAAFTVEEALEIMKPERGNQFDPQVFDVFIESLDEIVATYERFYKIDHAAAQVA
ncbi:MAG: HD domain-containing phosphohydrolase [Gaiellaceae bacterium]